MFKIHNTPWSVRPIILCTDSLVHPTGVCTYNKFQPVASVMIAYFKYSKFFKEQITTMDLPTGTMLLTADATSMYTNIQTHPKLNQMAQYFNGNKTKYRYLPGDAILRSLCLI